MPSTTFPNGQTLTSSALSPDALLLILQTLTAQMLGFNPLTSSDVAYRTVRLDWPQGGQPAWGINEDVVFLRAVEDDEEYSRIRDVALATSSISTVRQTITRSRTWRVHWTFYGPHSFDNARLISDAMLLDWTHDALAASKLYVVPEFPAPIYAPELYQGQWWKRTDIEIRLNEGITATVTTPSIASAEVLVYTDQSDLVADLTIPPTSNP
jgi:hypothetical protein